MAVHFCVAIGLHLDVVDAASSRPLRRRRRVAIDATPRQLRDSFFAAGKKESEFFESNPITKANRPGATSGPGSPAGPGQIVSARPSTSNAQPSAIRFNNCAPRSSPLTLPQLIWGARRTANQRVQVFVLVPSKTLRLACVSAEYAMGTAPMPISPGKHASPGV